MEIKKEPLLFEPYLKTVIWGGEKIKDYKNISTDLKKIGESWEISGVPGHVSVVAQGRYKGKNLNELIEKFGSSLLGEEVMKKYDNEFPLLIKIIDAADNLSVQVHPDDTMARRLYNGLGKAEMWYVINADKGAKIYAGLKETLISEEYDRRVEDGSLVDCLAVYDSEPGDVYFIPGGRVHAIGKGNLIAEIQETSDVSYRIYDFNRTDVNGKPRELHKQLAKEAIDFNKLETCKGKKPSDLEKEAKIAECEHFSTTRLLIDGETELEFSNKSFHILIAIEGTLILEYPEGSMELKKGKSLLLPAVISEIKLKGQGVVLLTSSLPD